MQATDPETAAELARLYDLDLADDPGDLDLYLALAGRADGRVVELCAGSGRIAIPLAMAGFDVTAVDIDPAMLARAGERARRAGTEMRGRLEFVTGDLHRITVPGSGSFGLGIIGLNSILLLGGPRIQRHAMAVLADLVAPGGLVVVDAWLPFAEDLVRFDGRLGLEWVRIDPDTGRTVVKTTAAWYDSSTGAVTLTTIFDASSPGGSVERRVREDTLHLLSADALRLYAEDAGLEVEVVAGGYGMTPLEPGDGRAVLVARRPHAS
ncbi:MAG: class I SAM-dependent methyltransferase [Chloroflexi bacterium]|nr:class I SAM-dependent methyltransferase [Chloroflexota bacterium]